MKLDNSTDGQHTDSRQRGKKTETRQLHMDMMKLDNSTNGHVESRQRGKRNWTTVQVDNVLKADNMESGQNWKRTTVKHGYMLKATSTVH